jgi:CsoR family transcriptional regulator, copper-sensing transcriptional repressor
VSDRSTPPPTHAPERAGTTSADATVTSSGTPGVPEVDRAERWAEKFERPALIAALTAIPATFLTLLDGMPGTAGEVLNTLSAVVLVGEGLVLFLASQDRRAWVRRNWWLLAIIAVVIPATIFAVGPAQLLRLTRSLGALRVLRVRRIIKAGKLATQRLGMSTPWRRVLIGTVSLISAAFVAVVLTDPTSGESEWIDTVTETVGPLGIVLAGLLLGVATYLVVRDRQKPDT